LSKDRYYAPKLTEIKKIELFEDVVGESTTLAGNSFHFLVVF